MINTEKLKLLLYKMTEKMFSQDTKIESLDKRITELELKLNGV